MITKYFKSMKFLKTICILICISFSTMAQDKNNNKFTLDDLIPGGTSYKLRPTSLNSLSWNNDTPIHTKGDTIWAIPITNKNKKEILIDKKTINNILESNNQKGIRNISKTNFLYPENSNIVLIEDGKNAYLIDIQKPSLLEAYSIPENAQNFDFSKEAKSYAYTKGNNLYIANPLGEEITVTDDFKPNILNGQYVHQREFGIYKGTFWSPSGKKLAYYKMDESMVTDYPLVDISTRTASLKDIKYPMAGMKSHHVRMGIFDPSTQKTVFLQTGTPKEKYLTNIAWSPDEKSIYIAEINRGQDTCKLNRYNATSGKLEKTLFTEIHPKYAEPENPVLFLKNDPQQFIWQSKKDGHNHLYLYDTDGNLVKQITKGNWDITEVIGFDESGNYLLYISTEATPIEKHIYKVDLKNNKRTQLSKAEGIHTAQVSPSGKYILDSYNSQYNPGEIVLTDIKSNKTTSIFASSDPLKKYTLPEITLGSIKANDNETDLYYRLIKPVDFDSTKQYPVIIYVYGGPHSQLVDNSWLGQARGWDFYMAQKGYIVFTLDNRGTNNRGSDFENITHRQLGVVETQDQMSGVEFLKSLPYVDTDRIGVHGWSYGGFMTLNMMLRHPEVFKVGVAGGPVTDWKYYEIMYGERYMDSPQENPEGYAETSMVNRAGDLEGRLLLIHGDEDPVVVMQHSLQFLKSAIKKGTHPDFFVYPGHGHNMIGKDRVHLHEHITRYFDDFLK